MPHTITLNVECEICGDQEVFAIPPALSAEEIFEVAEVAGWEHFAEQHGLRMKHFWRCNEHHRPESPQDRADRKADEACEGSKE